VALGIVKNSPSTFRLNHLLLPERCDRRFQVRHLKEQNSFVFRWVGLSPFSLKANKTCATVEFRVVPNLLIRHFKTKPFLIELLSSLQVVKVEFNTDELGVDRLHTSTPEAQYSASPAHHAEASRREGSAKHRMKARSLM
jgi:hypothetical protein